MKNRVLNTIIENKLISEKDNIIVGVSGGPDSIFLLHILNQLKESLTFNIIVCHINHGVRGTESDEDENFVREVCNGFEIPFHSIKVNMDEYAKKHKLTSEEAGRELRYKFFRETLASYNNKGKIAVAHNKNDQAETLIMRFFRGTGIDGLKGMEYNNGDIIRPILDIERKDIEKYILENNIKVRIDKTNKMEIYRRNSIRLNLIPEIKEKYNPAIIDTLYRTSRVMKRDSDFINEYTVKSLDNVMISKEENIIILDIDKLMKLHSAIIYRVIRKSIEKLLGHLIGMEEKHVESIFKLAREKKTGKRINIPNNLEVAISYNKLIITFKKDNNNDEFKKSLYYNKKNYIEELDVYVDLKVTKVNYENIKSNNRFIKYFDYDKIKGGLYIKNRESGDRFIPLGMTGTKKIKDYFIDEKIPRSERDTIPIIEDEEGILWVVGYRISNKYRIDETTKNILKITFIK